MSRRSHTSLSPVDQFTSLPHTFSRTPSYTDDPARDPSRRIPSEPSHALPPRDRELDYERDRPYAFATASVPARRPSGDDLVPTGARRAYDDYSRSDRGELNRREAYGARYRGYEEAGQGRWHGREQEYDYADYDPRRDRERREYRGVDDARGPRGLVDWRDQPASPPRDSTHPSQPMLPAPTSGRMALSSLLTGSSSSTPAPTVPPVLAPGMAGTVSHSPPGSPSSDARARLARRYPSPSPPLAATTRDREARRDGRPSAGLTSLDYTPTGGSQIFYGAPPGYNARSAAPVARDRDEPVRSREAEPRRSLMSSYDRDYDDRDSYDYGRRAGNGHGHGYSRPVSHYSALQLEGTPTPPRSNVPLPLTEPLGYSRTSRPLSPAPMSATASTRGRNGVTMSTSPVQGRASYGYENGNGRRTSGDDHYPSIVGSHIAAPASSRVRDHDVGAYQAGRGTSSRRRSHTRSDLDDWNGNGNANANGNGYAPSNGHSASRRRSFIEDGDSVLAPGEVAYKLPDGVDDNRDVWEGRLQDFQAKREEEVNEIQSLDIMNFRSEAARNTSSRAWIKQLAKKGRDRAIASGIDEADLASLPGDEPTPRSEMTDPFDHANTEEVPAPSKAKGRKSGAHSRQSTGGKGRSRKGKKAAAAELDSELLGLVEDGPGPVAASSVAAASSPPLDEDDEAPLHPDPETIVMPSGLTRREIIQKVGVKDMTGLTEEDVKQVQDEMWYNKQAEAKNGELSRRRDGRVKRKPGPAKGWKKLRGEDAATVKAEKKRAEMGSEAEEENEQAIIQVHNDGGEDGNDGVTKGLEAPAEVKPKRKGKNAKRAAEAEAEADIAALLDGDDAAIASAGQGQSKRKKRKTDKGASGDKVQVKAEPLLDDDSVVADAFEGKLPFPPAMAASMSVFSVDDVGSDRRSSFAGPDDETPAAAGKKGKSGGGARSKGAGKSKAKGKGKDLGPALSGAPLIPAPLAAAPAQLENDASFAYDAESNKVPSHAPGSATGNARIIHPPPADDESFYAPYVGDTGIPLPHAPLHFNTTPRGSDAGLPAVEEDLALEKASKDKSTAQMQIPGPKQTNVDDPRGVSEEEAHVRLNLVEELQKTIWANLVKDVPRVYRVMQGFDSANKVTKLRTAQACYRNAFAQRVNKPTNKTAAIVKKEQTTKAKKVVREMLLYWRRNEKDELLARKKAEKEALERAKQEEERRESKRQERKLHFLLTQTELYSHFIGKKIKTAEAERPDGETGDDAAAGGAMRGQGDGEDKHADVEGLDGDHSGELKELDYDEDDEENLRKHAARGAAAHARAAKEKAAQFDQQRAQGKAGASGDVDLKGVDLDGDELNFQEPSLGENSVTITQPKMLMAQLKEYQLKGLTWLGNLYEQGINGILADEMGLGKTIQSISLLAYLAEKHNLWGPFLVITPVSTLHNWIQEINRFVPALNVIPYWGQPKDREVLRSIWCKRHATYDRDSKFHVLVTSYQMAVQDEKYLSSLRWQYMILDEAQAIKSSSSMRWTTLLGLPCRNRLLLTGTPIQNSMQELWALLHFIMPSLFDSHEEFSEWFSKDIEKNAATGNAGNLQPEQLKRLHMILKPFMLRRVKKHVQKELGEKIEIDVMVDMSQRQKTLYRALRQRVSISELLAQANGSLSDSAGTKHLMNLVMQFRKVCSHPDLFERADVVSPFFFGTFSQSGRTTKEGDNMYCPASGRNAIAPTIPRLVWEDKVDRPKEDSNAGDRRYIVQNMMSIWNPDWINKRLKEEQERDDGFGFLRIMGQGPAGAVQRAKGHPLVQLVSGAGIEEEKQQEGEFASDNTFAAAKSSNRFLIPPRVPLAELEHDTPLRDITNIAWNRSVLSRKSSRFAIDAVSAAPIRPVISSRSYIAESSSLQSDPLVSRAMYGMAPSERNDPLALKQLHHLVPGISPVGLLASAPADQVPRTSLNVPPIKRLIVDSAKLARLDELLRELKDGGHRVLLYFQMTKMMDLVEEYLIFRQHKYLRLDGATVLEERRDMVNSWQTNPEIFVFCLSTRAGGLGINLTAADTVIFYDHDWNPSNDAQAMDRAHRVGQTKQVTVYRLITRNTIEERIVKMARAKKDVQDIVVGSKSLNDVAKPSEIASLLMEDEDLAESVAKRKQAESHGYVAPAISRQRPKPAFGDGLGVDDDEDDFFSGGQKATNNEDDDFEEVDPKQQGTGAVGMAVNGPAGQPAEKKKPSKKKKVAADGALAGVEGGAGAKKAAGAGGGGTKRKAEGDATPGDGKKKGTKKVKIVQPDEGAA